MRFKAILEEKNLSIDQLPKGVQKKISDLEKILVKVEEYKSSEEVDDEGLSKAEAKINDLDRDIEKALLRFNPEIYQKRLEVLNKIHKNNKKSPKAKEEKAESLPDAEQKADDSVIEKIKDLKKEVKEVEVVDSVFEEEEDDELIEEAPKEKHIEEELKRLKKSISHIENNTVTEELSKNGEAEPKKMSKGLILMGVGAFLLTWGAVNFFKERRG